jgi:hypothetical protein
MSEFTVNLDDSYYFQIQLFRPLGGDMCHSISLYQRGFIVSYISSENIYFFLSYNLKNRIKDICIKLAKNRIYSENNDKQEEIKKFLTEQFSGKKLKDVAEMKQS